MSAFAIVLIPKKPVTTVAQRGLCEHLAVTIAGGLSAKVGAE